mgnify:CR=1 FL=1|jgi:hypothetical protein
MTKTKAIPAPSAALLRGINQVWQQIGMDCEQCAAECGESIDNETAVEASMDADRLLPSMGFVRDDGAAHRELRELIDAHGYDAVHRTLCRHLRLA